MNHDDSLRERNRRALHHWHCRWRMLGGTDRHLPLNAPDGRNHDLRARGHRLTQRLYELRLAR